jgi:hypothetical protein
MAMDLAPATWITSWAENASDVTFPIASVPFLDADEADGTTGDMRKVLFALVDHVYKHYIGLATADRPTKMTITSSVSANTETGVLTNNYTFRFFTEINDQEVVDEPA